METFNLVVLQLDATLRISAPLILASMAGLFSERSGTINIALEGKMLGSAFAAAAIAFLTGSMWLGLLAAIGVAFALLHGFACISQNGNQVVSGVAINILAAGLTVIVGLALFSQGGQTPQLGAEARFRPVTWPLAETLRGVPILGVIYAELISGHNLLVYVALLAVPFTWWVVFRTRFGLRLRAVGENPEAVDTAGISVAGMRYRAQLFTGTLCGIAGAYLSIAQSAAFVREMTAGRGFIALAALVFGKWRPLPAMLACLLFGFLESGAARLQGTFTPRDAGPVTAEIIKALPFLIEAMPFILVVLLLAGFVGRATAPAAIGEPYIKER